MKASATATSTRSKGHLAKSMTRPITSGKCCNTTGTAMTAASAINRKRIIAIVNAKLTAFSRIKLRCSFSS
jgi:hypothetical protein